jgi:hypothetical protein
MDEPNLAELRVVAMLLATMVCSLSLAGCTDYGMDIMEQVPAPLTEAPAAAASLPAEHDLAILAIDFNPPLDQRDLSSEMGQVTLLIAVENRGLTQEKRVSVSAELSDVRRSETLLRQSTTLTSLAPGEVQVVRFSGISNVPYRKAYQLEVRVSPVEGEWALANNAKIYELTIKEPASAQASDFTSPLKAP